MLLPPGESREVSAAVALLAMALHSVAFFGFAVLVLKVRDARGGLFSFRGRGPGAS